MYKWRFVSALTVSLALVISCNMDSQSAPPPNNAPDETLAPVTAGWVSPMLNPPNGTIWYVAPNGADSNNGSENAPFATLQKAVDVVQPGQTIIVRTGMYTIDGQISIQNKQATREAPIFIRGEGMPVFKGRDNEVPGLWNGMVFIQNSSNIRVQGVRVENSRFFGFKVEKSQNIELIGNQSHISLGSAIYGYDVRDFKIVSNDVSRFCDKNAFGGGAGCQEGISLSFVDGFDIRSNLVHDAPQQPDVQPGGGEGIDVKTGSRNGYVRANKVWNLAQIGIYLDGWEEGVENVEVFANQVWQTYMGIVVNSEQGGAVRNIKLYNNLVRDVGYDGIVVSKLNEGTGGNGLRENIWVYNNTVHNAGIKEAKPPFCKNWTNGQPCGDYGSGVLVNTSNVKNINIYDNIISNARTATMSIPEAVRTKLSIQNNLVWPVGLHTWAEEFNGSAFINADPQFMNAAAGDFHLRATSPAVAKGSGSLLPQFDLTGARRNPPVDLGAFVKR
jgi:hypothetical protein